MEPPDVSGQGEALQTKNLADRNNKSETLNSLFELFICSFIENKYHKYLTSTTSHSSNPIKLPSL